MSDAKVSENQNVTVCDSELESYHAMGDTCYAAESTTLSEAYVAHLEDALRGNCVAMTEDEFEDSRRYAGVDTTAVHAQEAATVAPAVPNVAPAPRMVEKETVRQFNHKRAIWLFLYIAVALAAVLVMVFTIPGTAWEKKSIGFVPRHVIEVEPAMAETQTVSINTINTLDGSQVAVELEPYAQKTPETNWFDRLCDWFNGVVGG